MGNCNCDICENHEYSGENRMNLMETLYYIKGHKEMLDRRKCMLTMYNYCPWCGQKINWNEIKKLVKKK